MEVSEDAKSINIIKKVPIEQPIHIMQMDQKEILAEKKKFISQKMPNLYKDLYFIEELKPKLDNVLNHTVNKGIDH